ncbi:MAG: Ig-like domain-containing protein, partial [Lachnospiraceae bacterium]|nr:Ig-like domain-containing protein [Lachnospiraceae bacterium]
MKHGRNIRKDRLTRFRILILTGLFLILSAASVYAGTQKLTVKVTAAGKEIQKTVQLGEKLQLVVKNGKKTVSADKVSFASSKKKVVSVSKKGILSAKKAGTAVITVQYKKKQAKITVSVPDGPEIMTPNGAKTIKNYLLGAFIPVGKVLYVWGGGWTDATRKGISSTMKKWYNSQDKNYNYLKW